MPLDQVIVKNIHPQFEYFSAFVKVVTASLLVTSWQTVVFGSTIFINFIQQKNSTICSLARSQFIARKLASRKTWMFVHFSCRPKQTRRNSFFCLKIESFLRVYTIFTDRTKIDASVRKSALEQIGNMLTDPSLHSTFMSHAGFDRILEELRLNVKRDDLVCSVRKIVRNWIVHKTFFRNEWFSNEFLLYSEWLKNETNWEILRWFNNEI